MSDLKSACPACQVHLQGRPKFCRSCGKLLPEGFVGDNADLIEPDVPLPTIEEVERALRSIRSDNPKPIIVDMDGPPYQQDIYGASQHTTPELASGKCVECGADCGLDELIGYHYRTEPNAGGPPVKLNESIPDWASEAVLSFRSPHIRLLREKKYYCQTDDTLPPDVLTMMDRASEFWIHINQWAAFRPYTSIVCVYVKPCSTCDARDPFRLVTNLGDAYSYVRNAG